MMGWKLFWEHESKFDEAEREALIGTIVDSVIERALRPDSGYLPESLEPESSGFLHVSEGTGITPTVWPGLSTYRTTTTTYYSSSREGTFTLSNDV
jgi:hypothetical protein